MRNQSVAVLFFCFAFFIVACTPKIETQPLTSDDLAQAKAFAAPMVDNIIAGMQSRDYDTFSKDFNPITHDVLAKSNFEDMMKTFDEKIGSCTSPVFSEGILMNGNYALTYTLTCTKDAPVQMQVLFEPDDPHLIAGLFFTSPKLQQ